MDGQAVAEIRDLAQQAADTVTVGGSTFSPAPLHLVQPKKPEPEPLVVHTLQGLADYLDVNQDGLEPAEAAIHVVSPMEVAVVSRLHSETAQRFTHARATYEPRIGSGGLLSFGSFVPVEAAVVGIQALFEDAGDRAAVLKLIGNVRDEDIRTQADDGITQKVTAKAEIALDEVEVPNPVELAPQRTFPEVEQPPSPFVLRMKRSDHQGVMAALFEADGGAWKLDAIERLEGWLVEHVPVGFPILS